MHAPASLRSKRAAGVRYCQRQGRRAVEVRAAKEVILAAAPIIPAAAAIVRCRFAGSVELARHRVRHALPGVARDCRPLRATSVPGQNIKTINERRRGSV